MSRRNYKSQYISTLIANVANISYGLAAGWTSSSFLVLQSKESPIRSGPLNTQELSWINSILPIGALLGTLLYSYLSEKCGRKRLLYSLAVPQIISWLMILFATEVWHLYVSRVLAGISCGGSFVIVPIFVLEISSDTLRARLESILMLSANLGYLFAFTAGFYFDYATIPQLFLIAPVIYMAALFFVQETPIQLTRMNKIHQAEKSLKFYRKHSEDVLGGRKEHLEQLKRDALREKIRHSTKTLLKNIFLNSSLRRPQLIGLFLVILQELSGCYTMLSYTATIFEDCGSTISPNLSAITVGAVQLMGAFVSIVLIHRMRRKRLLICSSIGTGVSLLCLGCYGLANKWGYNVAPYSWISIASFSGVLFSAACGILPLPVVIMTEILPEKIRNLSGTICLCLSWMLSFFLVKFFETVVEEYGVHIWLFIFSSSCFVGAIFVACFVPESSGTRYEEFQPLIT